MMCNNSYSSTLLVLVTSDIYHESYTLILSRKKSRMVSTKL
jgi:hypothetical protein